MGRRFRMCASNHVSVVDVSKNLIGEPFTTCFQRMVFRRECVKDVAYKGGSCSEEMPYVLRGFLRANVLAITDSTLYGYRVLNGSMSHRRESLMAMLSYFDSVRCIARMLDETGKTVPKSMCRSVINRWLEIQVYNTLRLATESDRALAWNYWVSKLPRLMQRLRLCTFWQRIVARICVLCPCYPVAFMLCYFPHWLKLKGMHR